MVYFAGLPFIEVDGGLAPGEAIECPNGAAAINRAQAMAYIKTMPAPWLSRAAAIQTSASCCDPENLRAGAGGFRGNADRMIYRKGELSPPSIDRGWPHQVASPASACEQGGYKALRCGINFLPILRMITTPSPESS